MAATGSLLRKNDVIGKYQVERCLGIGGMGEVYLVRHIYLNTLRALKLLRMDIAAQDPIFCERFLREAKIASKVQHKNLIAVMDVENDEESGFFYIIMEYVNGNSLRDILKNGTLPEDQAIHIIAEVTEALAAAAEFNLVHRDIKPANIMISQEGEIKLADLGIAKASDDDVSVTLTMDNTLIGTPAYSSPEQCRNSHSVDIRTDIYSLGATLYEMVTGIPPFEGTNTFDTIAHVLHDEPVSPDKLNPRLTPEIVELIKRMMAKKPEERPQKIEDLQQELKRLRAYSTIISPEIKSLIHETVEKEVQERTSTVIETYRKKRKVELTGGSLAAVILLALICIIIFAKNGAHRREVRSYQAKIALLEKEKHNLAQQTDMLRKNLRHQERINFQRRGTATTADTLKQLNEEITELKKQNRNLRERLENAASDDAEQKPSTAVLPVPLPPQTSSTPATTAPVQTSSTPPPAAPVQTVSSPLPQSPVLRQPALSQREIRNKYRSLMFRPDFRKAFQELDAPELKKLCEMNHFTLLELSIAGAIPLMDAIRYYNLENRSSNKKRILSCLESLHENGFEFTNAHFSHLICSNGYRPQVGSRNEQMTENVMTALEYMIRIEACRKGHVHLPNPLQGFLGKAYQFEHPDRIIKLLVEQGGYDVNAQDHQGCTALDSVYFYYPFHTKDYFPALLQYLKRKGAKHSKYSETDIRLITAIREGDVKKVRLSIAAGADVRKPYPLGKHNPLYFAAILAGRKQKNMQDIIRELLNAGADPNSVKAVSILGSTLGSNDDSIAELLIRHGASLKDPFALRQACLYNRRGIAELLLKNGTSPNAASHYGGDSVLIFCLRTNKPEMAELLLRYGADVTRKGRDGKTSLELAQGNPKLRKAAAMIREKLSVSGRTSK